VSWIEEDCIQRDIPLTITKEEKNARNLPFYLSVRAQRGYVVPQYPENIEKLA
jgi:hypothetical protein